MREYLFGRRVGSEALAAFAALDYAAAPDPEGLDAPDMSEGINLFYHVQRAFAEAEVRAFARSLRGAAPAPGDIWYPSVGVLTCRRGPYALGAKAGRQRRQPQPQRHRQRDAVQGRPPAADRRGRGQLHPQDLLPPAV